MEDIHSGDVFEDEYGNRIRVLESGRGRTRVEYSLPTERFVEKFGENRVSSPPSDLLLVERLRDLDQYFPALDIDGFPYESPLQDEVVEGIEVVCSFDFDLDSDLNLSAVEVGLGPEDLVPDGPEDLIYLIDRFPGIIVSLSGEFESGFVVLFEDGLGAAFAESESVAEDKVDELKSQIETIGLL